MNLVNGQPTLQTDHDIQREIALRGLRYIRFETRQVNGLSNSKVVPARHFEKMSKNGIYFANVIHGYTPNYTVASVPQETDEAFTNLKFETLPETFRVLPWNANGKCARVLTRSYATSGQPCEMDCRVICERQFKRLKESGYELYSAFELEFCLFKTKYNDDGLPPEITPLWEGHKFCNTLAACRNEDFMYECEENLEQVGVDLETMNVEFGPGVFEWTMRPAFGIRSPDNEYTYKTSIKELALKRGWLASFAARPNPEFPVGCGAHLNHSLWNVDGHTGEVSGNAFYDENGEYHLSDVARWWLGGICAHANALQAFAAQTQNCYRRVADAAWAPGNITWGYENRTAMIRAKSQSPSATYFEYRAPSACVNGHLMTAALIAAGLDGIEKQMTPPPECAKMANTDENSSRLPLDLTTSLEALKLDDVICDALGREFVDYYVAVKKAELAELEEMVKKYDGDSVKAEIEIFTLNM